MGAKKVQKKKTAASSTTPAETTPAAAAAPAPAAEPTPAPAAAAESKPTPAPKEAASAEQPKKQNPKKTAEKKGEKKGAEKPAEDEWTLVTNKRRNKKKNKKEETSEKGQSHDRPFYGGRGGQNHGRGGARGGRHSPDEIIPFEHSNDPARVALFVTNEKEEDDMRLVLSGRPFEVLAVASLENVCHYTDPERKSKVRILTGVDSVRELMKELSIGLFVLPVDDDNLPGPRMSTDVSALLDVAVRAGAYALAVPVAPLEPSPLNNHMFFAAVPTQESIQLLVNTLGIVDDEAVRQDFEIHGFDIPEKAGFFDIYTSLLNCAIKKHKGCDEARVFFIGDQFIQDVAANIGNGAHYPVFTVSFKVGKLDTYTYKRIVYEIHSDEVTPDSLRNIYILLGAPVRQKLTIVVCKYQEGEIKYECDDPEKRVDVEFEKIIYSNSSQAESPAYELYLPRYVDPTATTSSSSSSSSSAPAPETEKQDLIFFFFLLSNRHD